MKLRITSRPEAGLNLFEVCVIVATAIILVALLVPQLIEAKHKAHKIRCVNNLMQVGLAYRVWPGNTGDMYPMGLSVTNGGTMEIAVTGNVVQTFLVMSNEIAAPIILLCPSDSARLCANTFWGLANSNVSYFINADMTNDTNPHAILSGDGNFELDGKPVRPGLLTLGSNDPVAWTATRHIRSGNLLLGDGSVQTVNSNGLHSCFMNAGMATNRLAIP